MPTDAIRNYIEKMTLILEANGMSRTAGRVLAYLLICSPREQSMHDLIDALGLSKSSISTSTQTLIQLSLIERVSLPGQRRDYYRIISGVWDKIMAKHIVVTQHLRDIAAEGIELIDESSFDGHCAYLQEMYEFYDFWVQEMPLLLERWRSQKEEYRKVQED